MSASQDQLPEIAVRIPGGWRSPAELGRHLPHGYRLSRRWLHLPGGDRVALTHRPPDREFPELFIQGCRRELGAAEQRRLRDYGVNVCLVREGGSVTAARRMLQASAAIVAGGGLGVFVDNSGNAHHASEWLGLACEPDDGAAILAYVGIYSDAEEVWSVGMHVLGQRDAAMPRSDDTDADLEMLSSLLGYALAVEDAMVPGDFVGDGGTRSFRLHGDGRDRVPHGHPMHNPYGRWRLEPVG